MLQAKGIIENLLAIGAIGFSGMTVLGLATERSVIASMGTAGMAGTVALWRETNRKDSLKSLESENADLKLDAENAARNVRTIQHDRDSLQADTEALRTSLGTIQEELNQGLKDIALTTGERDALKLQIQGFLDLSAQFKVLDQEMSQLSLDHENLQREHSQTLKGRNDLQVKADELEALRPENNRLKAQEANADELAKLRASLNEAALEKQLKLLTDAYDADTRKAQDQYSIYLALRQAHKEKIESFQQQFEFLTGTGFKEVEASFNADLDNRDQELMRLSGHVSLLNQPQCFESIGEYERANRLIKALYESEQSITLDASEIVPYSDLTGFDVYFNLRDRKARGQAFIDALNTRGNEFSILCGCVKDLSFEYDRINPHRIKTAMVFRKASKKEPKSAIDKHWTPASQFEKIYKLLKKPVTRVMGSTGEGKGIFVNLLLALEANQTVPTFTRLHDPVDGSSQDYWQISKISKGKSETTKAVKSFISEFNDRLESGISEPKTLDVFDEIDILADSDSSVNKAFLNSSKGMRHCGMRAYLIGQSPSVGKKGFEWADMDNFNAVYFGSAIITAIDKTPSLSTQSEALRKAFDKLKSFCDLQNEEGEFEEGNLYRVGLLVTSGKATFFELPSADSIVCDWSKLTQECEAKQGVIVTSNFSKTPNPECPVCGEKMRSASSNWLCQNRNHTKEMGKKTYLKSDFEGV